MKEFKEREKRIERDIFKKKAEMKLKFIEYLIGCSLVGYGAGTIARILTQKFNISIQIASWILSIIVSEKIVIDLLSEGYTSQYIKDSEELKLLETFKNANNDYEKHLKTLEALLSNVSSINPEELN